MLGNTWWALKPSGLSRQQEKTLLLWLNSSLSLLLFYGRRVVTQGAWMQMKKPAWESMPVLDVRALSAKQLATLARRYDSLAEQNLAPLAQPDSDPVRGQFDRAITDALGIPELVFIRELLEREPGLNAKDITPRAAQPSFADDADQDAAGE